MHIVPIVKVNVYVCEYKADEIINGCIMMM